MASRQAQASSSSSSSSRQKNDKKQGEQEKSSQDQASTEGHLELLTEHFGFNPKSFLDSLVYVSNEHLYIMGEKLLELVRAQLKKRPNGDTEAEEGVHAILTLFENALDHTFDTLELYSLKSVFGITSRQARYITLDHHRGLDLRSAEEKVKKGKGTSMASPLSAKQESEALSERERDLERKISAARAVQFSLSIANTAADQRLARIDRVVNRFSFLVGNDDDETGGDLDTPLPATIPAAARKLRADASALVRALQELRATDPLGASLNPLQAGQGGMGGAAGSEGREAWDRGREGYLAWETGRILAKEKREREASLAEEEPSTTNIHQSTSKRRREGSSKAGQSASGRRKSAVEQQEAGDDSRDDNRKSEPVGDVDQIEQLTAALQ